MTKIRNCSLVDKRQAFTSFHSDSYQYCLKKHLIGLVRNPLDLKKVSLRQQANVCDFLKITVISLECTDTPRKKKKSWTVYRLSELLLTAELAAC